MPAVDERPAPGSPMRPVLLNLWRFRWIVLSATLFGALVGWGLSQLQAERYEATAEMLLADPRDASLFHETNPVLRDPVRHVRNQARRLTSSAVAARTAELLDGEVTVTEVRERVQAVPSTELDLITVTASAPTGQEAAALANAVVDAYEDVIEEELGASTDEATSELRASLGQTQARVHELGQRLEDSPDDDVARLQLEAATTELLAIQQLIERLGIDRDLYGSGVETVEPAVEPQAPVAPRTLRNTILAGLLTLGAAAGVTVWQADALRRVDRRHEAQEVLGVPLLGSIPDLGEIELGEEAAYPTVSDVDSPTAEAFRFAAAALEAKIGQDVRTVVVTSAGAGDGKTTVALNLGVALQRDVRRVLLIDTDTRMHGLSRLTGTEDLRGVTDAAEGACLPDEAVHTWRPTARSSVAVTPVGRRSVDPALFFRTIRYRSLLSRLRQRDYLTIIDAPPLLAVSDASAIAGSADAIVLVVKRGTPVRLLEDLKERLAFVGTPVLGYVFNRASDRPHGYGYGYGYGRNLRASEDVGAGREVFARGPRLGAQPSPPFPGDPDGNGAGKRHSDRRRRNRRRRKRAARTRRR